MPISYEPPEGDSAALNFLLPDYLPPDGDQVGLEFSPRDGATTDKQYLFPVGANNSMQGEHVARNQHEFVTGSGFTQVGYGAPTVYLYTHYVSSSGIVSPEVGRPTIINWFKNVNPSGFLGSIFGPAKVFNLLQFLLLSGYTSARYGMAFVQGGVKYLAPSGLESFVSGQVKVINTSADQMAQPLGIAWPGMGSHYVSPRFLLPGGIFGTSTGFPKVQFPPRPGGWHSSVFGYSTVEYKTKQVRPLGADALDTGYPVVRDRARRILHFASAVTAVFGDIRIRLVNMGVQGAGGFDSLEPGDWAEVRSLNRWVLPYGIAATPLGETAARNKTPSFAPAGIASQAFGGASVGWRVRTVAPAGVPMQFPHMGIPSLWHTPGLSPVGIEFLEVPAPSIWPGVRYLIGGSWLSQKMGEPGVDFTYRRVVAEGEGVGAASYGTARVERANRGIAFLGASFLEFGMSWVSPGTRRIEPIGIENVLLHRHSIGGTRYLGAEGFDSLRWLNRIVPEAQEVYPKTFEASYGWPTLQNSTRFIPVHGITTYTEPSMHWGTARFWNSRQIIEMVEDQQSELWPLPWPIWTLIENRNKVVGTAGTDAARVPVPVVVNNARPVLPHSMPAPSIPEFQRAGSVTYRVRPLPLQGMEPPYMPHWAVVHNKAVPIRPSGLVPTYFGTARLVNTRRLFSIQGWDAAGPSYPFIAYAIRQLTFESRYGIDPPRIALPTVKLHTRYIEPRSLGTFGPGVPALSIYFRRITPQWTHSERSGYALVRNRTPEMMTRGRVSEEWGNTKVRLGWRPINGEGSITQLFGKLTIADRKQSILVRGASYLRVGDKLTMRRIGEDPIATQYIDLRTFFFFEGAMAETDDGHGIAPPIPQMGKPDLTKGYVFHYQLSDSLLMGRPAVTANTIRVEPGYWDFQIGVPVVSLFIRKLEQKFIPNESDVGKPRLSPHTIYAVLEAPEQAIRNHPESVQGQRGPVNDGVRLGNPRVSTWNPVILALGIPTSGNLGTDGSIWGVGSPSLYNRRQQVRVVGVHVGRMGWVTVPAALDIIVEDPASSGAVLGGASVGWPPYLGPQFVRQIGSDFYATGGVMVEHRNRTVRALGHLSEEMGSSRNLGTLYMPQALYVGPRRPTIPDGFEATAVGDAWVSHQVRGVSTEGFESFASEYDYQKFKLRMRVQRVGDNYKPRQIVVVHGFVDHYTGAPSTRVGRQYIRPDGNSDQYRKGAF